MPTANGPQQPTPTVTTPCSRVPAIAALLALASACAPEPSAVQVDRIFNGTDLTERNGSVVIRLKKTAKELEADPTKAYWYCSGALVAENCVVTASHCVRGDVDRLKKDGDVWHPDASNNWPAGGNNAGRPKPKDGETVSEIIAVADRGNNNHQDLAVLKLKSALPGPTLAVGTTHPKASDKFKGLVLGNGSTETGAYGHRSLELQVFSEVADPKLEGWSYLYLFDPATWKEVDDKKRKKIAPGDSGGPVLYDGKIIAVVSRGFTPDAPENQRVSMAASVIAPEAQKWLSAQIKEVCGDGGGTSTGGEESSGGATTGGYGDDGTTGSWSESGGWSGTTGCFDGSGCSGTAGSDSVGSFSTTGGEGTGYGSGETGHTSAVSGPSSGETGSTSSASIGDTGELSGATTGFTGGWSTGWTSSSTGAASVAHDADGEDWTASEPWPQSDLGVATTTDTSGGSSEESGDTDLDDVPEPIACVAHLELADELPATSSCDAAQLPGD
ncbi:MAG: trypsin-like serine protease [Deltaproteobacteria bacterium]|nr:trypsin-like serine protease [Deltaproteobacteria bacterium]